MYNYSCNSPTVINCTFSGNTTGYRGGGIYNEAVSSPTITNCIFWNNTDSSGSAESAQIHNYGASSVPVVTYSCIQACSTYCAASDDHNIGDDPLFVSGSLGDYYLSQIASGQPSDSPCLDAGRGLARHMYFSGTTRTDGIDDAGTADIGYHYDAQVVTRGDLDADHDVDGHDFLTFSQCFNGSLRPAKPSCTNWRADIDLDDDVDGTDFLMFSRCFNGSLRPPKCP